VTGAPIQRVVLEIEPGEPIHGRLAAASEPSRRFHGWLELTALLDGLRPADPSPSGREAPPNPSLGGNA
jgi:hypothetical protein